MRVYDEPVDEVDKSGARRKASRLRHFAKVAPSRLRRRRKQRMTVCPNQTAISSRISSQLQHRKFPREAPIKHSKKSKTQTILRQRQLARRIACSDVLCKPERHSPRRVWLNLARPLAFAHPLNASRTKAIGRSRRPGRRLLRPSPVRGPDGDRDRRRGDNPKRQMSHRYRKQHGQKRQDAKRPQQGLCNPAHCPASPQFHCASTLLYVSCRDDRMSLLESR